MTNAVARDAEPDASIELRRIDVGEVTLNVAVAGRGPLVVLLHGFPWPWFSWRRQIAPLVRAGFRVAAPDMRGYDLSDKPRGVDAYGVERLTEDVDALVRALGEERAHVVGHDWGAIVAWYFAMSHPRRVDRLAIMNVPHPALYPVAARMPEQVAKSWYIAVFQIPWVAERIFRRDGYRGLWRLFPIDGASEAEIAAYLEAASRDGALTAAMSYYRAGFRRFARGDAPPLRVIDRPVLVLWGERDHCLSAKLASPPPRWVPHARVVLFPKATHWVHLDEAPRVNELLVEFLSAPAGGARR
jgi:pimeloyl-ACP methyl ester carboxylesterase